MADTEHTPGKIQHHVLMGTITVAGRTEDIFHCGLGLRPSRYLDEQAANARRLAACWNACVGVETELLEQYPAPFSEMRAQRDALLAAFELVMDRLVDRHETDVAAVEARAAIAKVKGAAA